jgi:hypothetical protein
VARFFGASKLVSEMENCFLYDVFALEKISFLSGN